MTALVVAGCRSDPRPFHVEIYDAAQLWTTEERQVLETELSAIARSIDADFVLVSENQVPAWRLPIAGDEAAKASRPPGLGWWKRQRNGFPVNDVVLFVTREPALVQVRYGGALAVQARAAAIDAGPRYREIQREAHTGSASDLIAAGRAIQQQWVPRSDIPWWRRWFLDWARTEVEQLLSLVTFPDLKLWYEATGVLVRPLARAMGAVTSSAPLWVMMMFLVGWVLEQFISKLFGAIATFVGHRTGGRRGKGAGQVWSSLAAKIFYLIFVAIPGLELILLALSGRGEDAHALYALTGSQVLLSLPPLPGTFGLIIGIGLAVLVVLAKLIHGGFGNRDVTVFAGFEPADQKRLYKLLPEEVQGRFDTIAEFLTHDELSGVTDSTYREAPFSTLRDGFISSELRGSFRIILGLLVLPAYLAGWFVFTAILHGVGTLVRLPSLGKEYAKVESSLARIRMQERAQKGVLAGLAPK